MRFQRKIYCSMVEIIYSFLRLNIFKEYRWLLSTLSWSSEQRERWRLEKLNNILEFSWRHVAFYREFWGDHGLNFHRLKSTEELEKYPILRKELFKKNAHRVIPDNLNTIRHIKKWTGGTTGRPVQYLKDLEQWTFSEGFHLWGWTQLGYVLGDPVGIIAGGSLIPERVTYSEKVRNWMHRRLFLFGVAMDISIARDFHHRLVKHRAKYIYGYPSSIYLFSKYLHEEGLFLPEIKAVVTTAEMLLPQYRLGIENNLKVPVYNNLGGNDGGYESYECSLHNGLHYNDLQAVLEVEEPKKSNGGNLIITNLWNRSTPFIRYENGDLVTLKKEQCACNCSFPLIASIDGRTADILKFANGRSITGPGLTLIFGEMEIDGWQVVQKSDRRLEIRICCTSGLRQEYVTHINRILRRYLSDDVEIDIKKVDELEVTLAGKRKPIWSEIYERK